MVLDMGRILDRPNVRTRRYGELCLEFVHLPGAVATCRLEDAPRQVVDLDPMHLPEWLVRLDGQETRWESLRDHFEKIRRQQA